MENIAGTAGVSDAETPRERGSEDRLAAGEGNVSIVGKVWEMQKWGQTPLTRPCPSCILGPIATRRGGVPTPPPRKKFQNRERFAPKLRLWG